MWLGTKENMNGSSKGSYLCETSELQDINLQHGTTIVQNWDGDLVVIILSNSFSILHNVSLLCVHIPSKFL